MKLIYALPALLAGCHAINFEQIASDAVAYLEDEGYLTLGDNSALVSFPGEFTASLDWASHDYGVKYGSDENGEFENKIAARVLDGDLQILHEGKIEHIGWWLDLTGETEFKAYNNFNAQVSVPVDPAFLMQSLSGGEPIVIHMISDVDGSSVEIEHSIATEMGLDGDLVSASVELFTNWVFAADYDSDLLATVENMYGFSVQENEYNAGARLAVEADAESCMEGNQCTATLSVETVEQGVENSLELEIDFAGMNACAASATSCYLSAGYELDWGVVSDSGNARLSVLPGSLLCAITHDDTVTYQVRMRVLNRKLITFPVKKLLRNVNAGKFGAFRFVQIDFKDGVTAWEQVVKAPLPGHLPVVVAAANEVKARFTPYVNDFKGTTEGLPNALYGIAYADQLLVSLVGKFDFSSFAAAVGFESNMAGLSKEVISTHFTNLSDIIDEYLVAPVESIADVRETVHEITGSKGRTRFETVFANTLSN